MPLRSGGALDNEYARGRANLGLISISKAVPPNLYAGFEGSGSDTDLVKVDFETFTRVLGIANAFYYHILALWRGGLYSGDAWTTTAPILRINTKTLEIVQQLDLDIAYIWDVLVVGNYLYVASSNSLGKIGKVHLPTFTALTPLTTAEGVNAALGVSGNFLYASTYYESPEKIVKINLTTFTKVDTLNLPSGYYNSLRRMPVKDNYMYVGFERNPGRIVKIDLTNFTVADTLLFPTGRAEARGLTIYGNYLYSGTWDDRILKIDLDTFSIVDTLTISEWPTYDMVLYETYLYAGIFDFPSYILKIDLETFTEIDKINLPSPDDLLIALAAG